MNANREGFTRTYSVFNTDAAYCDVSLCDRNIGINKYVYIKPFDAFKC